MKHWIYACSLITILMTCAPGAYAQDTADQAGVLQPVPENEPQPQNNIYDDENLKPRDIYNLAFEQLRTKNYDVAAEGFLRARDQASFDNELRHNAAYNLAHTYAQRAESKGDINQLSNEDLQAVISDLEMSAAWFRDAVRQRPSAQESRGNLEIVLKRLLNARDVMMQKYNVLEHQLDAVIATERNIRENARVLSDRINDAAAARDPMLFQDDFKNLANIQREALTQANVVMENLDNAIAAIESTAEDQRSQEDAFRLFQLKSASPLLETARQAMGNARRQIRILSMADSLRLTNKAFNYLKQAREQLDNPLSILNHIAEDENGFLRIASAKYMFQNPELLEKYKADTNRDDMTEPAWLNQDLLTDTQVDTLIRTNRLLAFLRATTEAAAQQQQAPSQDPQAAAAQEQMEQIKEALPFVEAAASLMQSVTQKLEITDYKGSIEDAGKALEQLAMAMERFADLKHLIEIAYASQIQAAPVISGKLGSDESAQTLTREQQREMLMPLLDVNSDRLERLSGMLAKEAAKATQGQQGQQPPSEEQIQQIQKVFEEAENLRSTAANAIQRMKSKVASEAQIVVNSDDPENDDVQENSDNTAWNELADDAEIAQRSLEQLRIIFFTVVEHIQELYKQQTATLDQTSDVASAPADELELKLPAVIDRQHVHEVTADSLAEALVKQAETMQQQAQGAQPQGGVDPAEMAQKYREAASELQAAATVMRQVQTDLSNASHLFTEAIEEENTALEHIAKALELLQPPQQQQQNQDQQNQDQQNQDQQNQDQKKQNQQKMSKEQAEKKIQEIRQRDKERRKSNDEKRAAGMPYVEKDW